MFTQLLFRRPWTRDLWPKSQQQSSSLATIFPFATAREVGDIRITSQSLSNLPAGLDPPDHNQAVSSLGNGPTDGIRTVGFSLGPDDVGLSLLFCLLDDESRSFGVLLCDLFLLDSSGELFAEGHMRDGHIFERNVEFLRSLEEVGSDTVGDGLSLSDELGGVELSDDGLEHLVPNRGEDTFIVILTK